LQKRNPGVAGVSRRWVVFRFISRAAGEKPGIQIGEPPGACVRGDSYSQGGRVGTDAFNSILLFKSTKMCYIFIKSAIFYNFYGQNFS
jgi:hypothetical protein